MFILRHDYTVGKYPYRTLVWALESFDGCTQFYRVLVRSDFWHINENIFCKNFSRSHHSIIIGINALNLLQSKKIIIKWNTIFEIEKVYAVLLFSNIFASTFFLLAWSASFTMIFYSFSIEPATFWKNSLRSTTEEWRTAPLDAGNFFNKIMKFEFMWEIFNLKYIRFEKYSLQTETFLALSSAFWSSFGDLQSFVQAL